VASSRKTQIIAALLARLRTIKVAAGYERDVMTVHRSAAGLPMKASLDGICILSAEQDKRNGLEPVAPVTLTVTLLAVVREHHDLEDAVDALEADIEKAIGVDPSFGELAIDSRVVACRELVSEGLPNIGGTEMVIEIKFRHGIGDPYSAT